MHSTLPSNPSLPFYLSISSTYLTLQSLILLLSPRLISTLLSSSTSSSQHQPVSELETYLSRALGLALLGLAAHGAASVLTSTLTPPLIRTGIPAASAPGSASTHGTLNSNNNNNNNNKTTTTTAAAAAVSNETAILVVTLAYHTICTVHGYINSTSNGSSTSFLLHALISGALSCYGLWVLMFGAQVRVGSVDGRDKRVSGILFGAGGGREGKEL